MAIHMQYEYEYYKHNKSLTWSLEKKKVHSLAQTFRREDYKAFC